MNSGVIRSEAWKGVIGQERRKVILFKKIKVLAGVVGFGDG